MSIEPKTPSMVSVLMITYNHEDYIAQAIEGVLAQEVNFHYELIIGEDCSKDKTKDIVEYYQLKYPSKIKLISSEQNIGCVENELRLLQISSAKYIAYCEGDDFWTDPYKLQKQVDFLEANPDYGLVHGDVNHYYQHSGETIYSFNKKNNIKIPSGNIFEYLLSPSHAIKTMTVCVRKDLITKHYLSNEEITRFNWFFIDISLWLMISLHSKMHYVEEVFATYRLLPESMSRTRDSMKKLKFHQMIYDIRCYFHKNHSKNPKIKKEIDQVFHLTFMSDAYNLSDFKLSWNCLNLLRKNKVNIPFKYYLLFLLTFCKKITGR